MRLGSLAYRGPATPSPPHHHPTTAPIAAENNSTNTNNSNDDNDEVDTDKGQMTELSYSKSFLAVVARLPTPLSADHVQDPRQLPARSPVSIPPPPHPQLARAQ